MHNVTREYRFRLGQLEEDLTILSNNLDYLAMAM